MIKRPLIAPGDLDRIPPHLRPHLLLAAELVDQIAPILADTPSQVQSIVLAHFLHVWVCGHYTEPLGDARVQARFRKRILDDHVRMVRALVDEEIKERAKRGDEP